MPAAIETHEVTLAPDEVDTFDSFREALIHEITERLVVTREEISTPQGLKVDHRLEGGKLTVYVPNTLCEALPLAVDGEHERMPWVAELSWTFPEEPRLIDGRLRLVYEYWGD